MKHLELDALYAEPCQCVSCGDCGGSGKIWVEQFGIEEPERCDTCDGSGLTEVCQRCMDIEEIEREEQE